MFRRVSTVLKDTALKCYCSNKLNSVDLAYDVYESETPNAPAGPPLVVAHGLYGSKRNWRSFCRRFAKDTKPQRKIIAVDARNHGDSPHTDQHSYEHMCEDLNRLFEKLQLKKMALFGHSMGGGTVMMCALKHSDLVEKLVVVDFAPKHYSFGDSMKKIIAILDSVSLPNKVPMNVAKTFVDEQLKEAITISTVRKFLLTNLKQQSNGSYAWKLNLSALKKNVGQIFNFPSLDGAKFHKPVLFLKGELSDFIQVTDHARILELFPLAKIQTIKNASHWVYYDNPQQFYQYCLEFLNAP